MKTLREEIEKTLRSRGYDNHAHDEEIFEELLDELMVVIATRALTQHKDGDIYL